MAELTLIKIGGGMLAPADEQSRETIGHWKHGQGVRATVRRMRNIKFHRRFFALLTVIAENSEVYDNTDKALIAVKLASGHVDWVMNPETAELVPVPKSISFVSMDEDEFSRFYDNALTAVLKHILPAMNRVSLDRAVEMVSGFA